MLQQGLQPGMPVDQEVICHAYPLSQDGRTTALGCGIAW